MNVRPICYSFLAAAAIAAMAIESPARIDSKQTQPPVPQPGLNHDYGKLPLAFEPNIGQTDSSVRFLARGGGITAYFTDTETAMVLSRSTEPRDPKALRHPHQEPAKIEQAVVRMKLAGSMPAQR